LFPPLFTFLNLSVFQGIPGIGFDRFSVNLYHYCAKEGIDFSVPISPFTENQEAANLAFALTVLSPCNTDITISCAIVGTFDTCGDIC
jgi:hypothetical protein